MEIFYKKWKKYNEIYLTKNKMDLNIRKITNHPPSPAYKCFTSPCFTVMFQKIISLGNKISDAQRLKVVKILAALLILNSSGASHSSA